MRKYDLTNKVFGKLTVVKLSEKKKHRVQLWECKCECGNTIYVRTQNLIEENRKCCGCTTKVNLVGYKTGRLTVIAETESRRYDKTHVERVWLCQCECGDTTKLSTAVLTKSKVNTCGCAMREVGNKNSRWRGYGEISGSMWKQIRSCGTLRDLEFTISIEQIWDLFLRQERRCALSGLPLGFGDSNVTRSDTTASLDRIDSSRGYVIDNVQWVHKDINAMKSDLDQSRFRELCCLVAASMSSYAEKEVVKT